MGFTAHIINTETLDDAISHVENNCDLEFGQIIHETQPEMNIDWNIGVKPKKEITRGMRIKNHE